MNISFNKPCIQLRAISKKFISNMAVVISIHLDKAGVESFGGTSYPVIENTDLDLDVNLEIFLKDNHFPSFQWW